VNPHTLASLRLTLLELEKSSAPGEAAEDLAVLMRILLNRIAALEAMLALTSPQAAQPQRGPPNSAPDGSDIV
jgi:hypothetical protein